SERERLIEAFLEQYPARIEDARARLGENFDEGDYPQAERLRRSFSVSWRFVQLGAPEAVRSISGEVYERERARAREEADGMGAAHRSLLRAELNGLVEHMVHALRPLPDGRRRRLRRTAVPAYLEGLALIRARMAGTDDGEVAEALARAEALAGEAGAAD